MRTFGLSVALILALQALAAEPTPPTPRFGAGTEYDGITIDTAPSASAAHLPAALAIDARTLLRPIASDHLGICTSGRECDDHFMGGGTTLTPEIQALLPRLPLHLLRIIPYADGSLHGATWTKGIGPMAERPPMRFNQWEKLAPNTAGPVELVGACEQANPATRLVWVVDVRADDHEALARYLTGPATGGEVWAGKRAAAGRPAPFPVVLWELGNEVEWVGPKHALSLEDYIARCKVAIAAIRRVQPDARFAPHMATAPWAWEGRFKKDWRSWHRAVLKELHQDIDYLAFHPYYYGYPTSVVESYMDQVQADIRSITGAERIRFYISEHGLWPNAAEGQKWETSWWQTHGIPGCLATAQFLNRMGNRADVGPMTYHNLSAGPWGLLYRGKETGRIWTTGMVDLFALYGRVLGDQVVQATWSGEQTDPRKADCSLTALATRRGDGLGLVLVNRLPKTSRLVSFSFGSETYDLVEATTLTAANPQARNTQHEAQITLTTDTTPRPAITTYEVPPLAVVGLRLKRR